MKQATLDAMKAFAEGKRIIVVENGSPIASPIEHKSVGPGGKITFSDFCDYEICYTMQVNGREYPCPATELKDAEYYYLPSPTVQFAKKFYCVQVFKYIEDPFEPMLSSGLVHSSAEAADIHARALFGYPDRPAPTPEEVTAHDMAAIQKQEDIVQMKAAVDAFDGIR